MNNLMEKFGFIPADHVKPNWFPVKVGDVYDSNGKPVPNYRRVYRDDSGDTLAVHSAAYRLISYEDSFTAFDKALADSGLNLSDMRIATDLTHNGARCFRQYLLPEYQVEMSKGDATALRIIMFNSYDGSCRFSGMAGGYRFVCANTSVFGHDLVKIGVKHVGNEDIDHKIELTISKLVAETAKAIKRMERMKEWTKIGLEITSAKELLQQFPQKSDLLIDRLTSRYAINQDGNTLWNFYNVLTTWSTHLEDGSKNAAATRSAREQRVATFIDCPEWKHIENVGAYENA